MHGEVRHAHQGTLERLEVRRRSGSRSMRRNRGWFSSHSARARLPAPGRLSAGARGPHPPGELPRSQPRTVATEMPIRRANSACDSPARRRTRRAQAAASMAASASSSAAWRSISASVVASTRARSDRDSTGSQAPAGRRRVTAPVASRRASVRAIPAPLPGVCLAGGDDPGCRLTPRVGDHE